MVKPQQNHPTVNPTFLYISLFYSGAAVLVIEVLGARLMSPYFGVGLYVWSALITIALGALSIGYWWGGQLADRNPHPRTLYSFFFLGGILSIFIPMVAPFVLPLLMKLGLRIGSLVAAVLLFAPSLLALGMISPYAARIYTTEINVLGRRVGHLYAVSTIGSCAGSLVTGFILIPHLGVDRIFYLVSSGLFLLWFANRISINAPQKALALIPLLFGLVLSIWNPSWAYTKPNAKILYDTHSLYGHLQVKERGEKRWLLIDGAPNSGINKRTQFPTTQYTYNFELMPLMRPEATTALVVGLGGASIVNRFKNGYNLKVDAVEIDAEIVRIAENYFFYKPRENSVWVQDARQFILTTSNTYDLIIYDVFTGDLAPVHLFSDSAIKELKRVLNQDGIFGINYIGNIEGPNSRATRSIYKTLSQVFSHVAIYGKKDLDKVYNLTYLASDTPLELKKSIDTIPYESIRNVLEETVSLKVDEINLDGAIVLTDLYNPAQMWNLHASETYRRNILQQNW